MMLIYSFYPRYINGGNVSTQLLWKLSEAFNGKFDNSDTIRIYDWGSSYYPDVHFKNMSIGN